MLEKIITLLYLNGNGASKDSLSKLLNVKKEVIENELENIKKALNSIGLTLVVSNDDLSITTKPENSSLVESFWKEELEGELTPATLQVLTLVAYLNGSKKEDISYIRGVQSSQSIRTLMVRGLIKKESDKYYLTTDALKYLGVENIEMLPDYSNLNSSLIEKLKMREID